MTKDDECRWCGNPQIHRLGLCSVCYQERLGAETDGDLEAESHCPHCETRGLVDELANRNRRQRIMRLGLERRTAHHAT